MVGPVGPGYVTLRDHGCDRVAGVSMCVKEPNVRSSKGRCVPVISEGALSFDT